MLPHSALSEVNPSPKKVKIGEESSTQSAVFRMGIKVICPSCNRRLAVPDGLVGKSVKCPGCSTIFNACPGMLQSGVPTTLQCPCPNCRQSLLIDPTWLGQRVKCPACKRAFTPQPDREPTQLSDPPTQSSEGADTSQLRAYDRKYAAYQRKRAFAVGFLVLGFGCVLLALLGCLLPTFVGRRTNPNIPPPPDPRFILGSCFPFLLGIILIIVGSVLGGQHAEDPCPKCERLWAVIYLGSEIVKPRLAMKKVYRSIDFAVGHMRGGGDIAQQVVVLRATLKHSYTCRYCGYRWVVSEIRDTENFEFR
jgi:hypothetical protein